MPKRLLCETLPTAQQPAILSESEARHATRVLRLREGDIVEVINGKGQNALATLRTKGHGVRVEYLSTPSSSEVPRSKRLEKLGPLPICLELAVLKGEAMEWAVEKAVELDIGTLTPILTDRTVIQIKQKGPEFFQDRWQKIADQALKQCGRLTQLKIEAPLPLETLLARPSTPFVRFWCDEQGIDSSPYFSHALSTYLKEYKLDSMDSVRVLVGPEGGWSTKEHDLLSQCADEKSKMHRVNLGPLTLRAETAALFAVSLLVGQIREVQTGSI